ncbi:MAG: alpha/beta fold hydrolase [Methylococcus sp.]|nr:alpha/beta fold hydrolase [Methylococcus sp.]
MATFVLIHGAMHGGWAWASVRRYLQRAGHEVFTPSLTGQGKRRHLLTHSVGVETHIEDITSLLWFEDLRGAVLVLHSYAGILAGPVAEAAADRLSCIVLAGGFHVQPGQCLLDIEPADTAQYYRQLAAQRGDGWFLPPLPEFLDRWGIADQALRGHVGARLTRFPFKCQTDPVAYEASKLRSLRRVYIEHIAPPLRSLQPSLVTALADGFEHIQIVAGHDMMLTEAAPTAALLAGLASR